MISKLKRDEPRMEFFRFVMAALVLCLASIRRIEGCCSHITEFDGLLARAKCAYCCLGEFFGFHDWDLLGRCRCGQTFKSHIDYQLKIRALKNALQSVGYDFEDLFDVEEDEDGAEDAEEDH